MKSLEPKIASSELLERLYLQEARDKAIYNLSSGMRQRLKLALALWSDVRILLLDEPGTNLDSTAFDWYLRELAQVPADRIIIIASNNATEYPSSAKVLHMPDLKGKAV